MQIISLQVLLRTFCYKSIFAYLICDLICSALAVSLFSLPFSILLLIHHSTFHSFPAGCLAFISPQPMSCFCHSSCLCCFASLPFYFRLVSCLYFRIFLLSFFQISTSLLTPSFFLTFPKHSVQVCVASLSQYSHPQNFSSTEFLFPFLTFPSITNSQSQTCNFLRYDFSISPSLPVSFSLYSLLALFLSIISCFHISVSFPLSFIQFSSPPSPTV